MSWGSPAVLDDGYLDGRLAPAAIRVREGSMWFAPSEHSAALPSIVDREAGDVGRRHPMAKEAGCSA